MSTLSSGGFLLVDKPEGVTSFQVVNHVRSALIKANPGLSPSRSGRTRGGPRPPRFKCGHAGTLDPMATGLLIVMVGKGSRLSHFLLGQDKTYLATVSLGTVTDTLDRMGQVVQQAPVSGGPEDLAGILASFRGDILQVPPLISALKRDGKPLYKRVRSGEEVAAPAARPVRIHELELQAIRWNAPGPAGPVHEIDLRVNCSSGTYVRSLARDIAEALGTVGHLKALRRTEIGPFTIAEALAGVMDLAGDSLAAAVRPLTQALPQVPRLVVAEAEAAALRLGQQPPAHWLDRLDQLPVAVGKSEPLFALVDRQEQLVALGKMTPEGLPAIALVIPGPTPAEDGKHCD